MADNSTLPADGDKIRDIDRAGVKTQVVALDIGGQAAESLLTVANPMPVAVSALPLPAGAATAAGQADIVAAINANGGGGGGGGGSVTVSNFPATQPVSAAALPLPAGAATAAGVAAVVTALGSPLQAGGAVSITGTAAVSAAALPLPSGAATAAGVAAVVTALGTPLQAGGTVALDGATLTALENINATVTGTVALDAPSLAALENTNVTLAGLTYPASTNNSSVAQLVPGTPFVGVIETILNQQAAQIEVVCDQPYSVTINQYIDQAGTKRSASDTLYRKAGEPLSINVTLPGNYFNIVVANLGIEPTDVFELNTTFGIMDSGPRRLGRTSENDSMPVTFSNEDADLLNDVLQRLGVLSTARNVDGSLRVTLLGGTVATVTTVGTVTTVTTVATVTTVNTVTTVSTLSNQTNVGGYGANNQVPSLMNLAAASNIDRMVG